MHQAGVRATLVETRHAGHGAEVVAGADLRAFQAVLVVGGDGMLSEVVNALWRRPDAPLARQLPVGIIPGGSSNGYATSLLARAGEPLRPTAAALAALRHRVEGVDVAELEQRGAVREPPPPPSPPLVLSGHAASLTPY